MSSKAGVSSVQALSTELKAENKARIAELAEAVRGLKAGVSSKASAAYTITQMDQISTFLHTGLVV